MSEITYTEKSLWIMDSCTYVLLRAFRVSFLPVPSRLCDSLMLSVDILNTDTDEPLRSQDGDIKDPPKRRQPTYARQQQQEGTFMLVLTSR